MKTVLLFIYILLSLIGYAQQLDSLNEYPYLRSVDNQLTSEILNRAYLKSVNQIDSIKLVVKNRIIEQKNMEEVLRVRPNYLHELDSMLDSPRALDQVCRAYNIGVKIDDYTVMYYDTASNRQYYLQQLEREQNNSILHTIIGFSFNDLKSTPQEHYRIPTMYFDGFPTDSLDDGRYIMRYAPVFDRTKNKFLVDKPYCIFNLKDHKMNGEAIYYTPYGDTVARGLFKDNKQVGEWKIKMPYNKTPYSFNKQYGALTDTTTIWSKYIFSIVNDSINGEYKYFENDVLMAKGYIENNQPVGNWELFHPNGALANRFTLRKTPVLIEAKNVLFINHIFIYSSPKDSNTNYYPGPTDIALPYGNYQIYIPGYTYELLSAYGGWEQIARTNSSGTIGIIPNRLIKDDRRYQEIWFVGLYEAYFDNGQLRYEIERDGKGQLIKATAVYDYNGNIILPFKKKYR